MNNELNDYYRQIQKEESKNVFYGDKDIISRPGFDSIEGFDKGIKDVKETIKDYDLLISANQSKLKEVVRDLDLYERHPNVSLPGEVERLTNLCVSLEDKHKEYSEKKEKEKKYLDEILEAKKEFIRETRFNYKSEARDRVNLLNEYDAKMKEMKDLEGKIAIGKANDIDKARYDNLKNEVIPDLEVMLNRNKKDNVEDFSDEALKEVADRMTVDEMNTILNMKASNNFNDEIMKKIADRLGVDQSKLVDIATSKNADLEKDDVKENDSNDKSNDVDNNKDNSSGSSDNSSGDEEKEQEKDDSTKLSADMTPEERKKPSKIAVAGAKLVSSIKNNKKAALIGIASIAAVTALAITNPAMLVYIAGAAGLAKIYKDYKAGTKLK